MDQQAAQAALAKVGKAMREQFGEHHPDRLAQLDATLATAGMAVGHLFDEEERRVDNEQRREERIRAELEGRSI